MRRNGHRILHTTDASLWPECEDGHVRRCDCGAVLDKGHTTCSVCLAIRRADGYRHAEWESDISPAEIERRYQAARAQIAARRRQA